MTVRDEFFWLGEINKATLVINSSRSFADADRRRSGQGTS